MVDLDVYRRRVDEIRNYAKENNISESELNQIFEECFEILELQSKKPSNTCRIFQSAPTLVFLTLLCCVGFYNHPPTLNLLLRNLQTFIYPGFKIFRKLAVPVISKYPSLTEWYDESCLLENPYFQVADMDCWPCGSVRSVPDLSGHNISSSFNTGIPYTRVESGRRINMKDIYNIYRDNKNVFDEDAGRISSNNASYRSISDVMLKRLDLYPSESQNIRLTWRINRMKPGRILRKLFPKPVETPNWWGQSTERFLFLDEPKAPSYPLPNPECSNIVLRCTNGERLIKLEPSPECRQKCKSATILLSAHQTLWFNWWYWRPVSFPTANSTTISITYLTSFCS